jgi:hypothetical protein
VADGEDDVAGAGFALGADHGRALGDAAQSLAQVARAADKGRGEGVLVDVMGLVGGGEDLALVDEVDAQLLEDLRLGEVADAGLGHDGNGDGLDDLFDERGLGHAGHAAFGANHGGNALESHDGGCAGLFGDARLLDVHHVHDDAAFEHLGEADFEAQAGGGDRLISFDSGMEMASLGADSGLDKARKTAFWCCYQCNSVLGRPMSEPTSLNQNRFR